MEITGAELIRFYPLDSMRPEHVELLTKEGIVREWKRGEILFSAGATDNDTLFLISGEVRGDYPDGRLKNISSDSVQSRYALGDLQPRRFTAKVESKAATTMNFDRRFLEKVLTWDQITRAPGFKAYDGNPESNRWVFRMLQSKALQKLPAGSLERLFSRFEEIQVRAEQTVIREGEDPDYFYVIKDGSATVSRTVENGGEAVIAYLVRGDSFGEDALMSNSVRNASVAMKKNGTLMRLSKANFQELLKHSVVEWVTAGKASILFRQGALLLDVRMSEEFEDRAIKGAINVPLFQLREMAQDLDKSKKYVIYCNTGERSASAAFILGKLGFEVYGLQGGLSSMLKSIEPKKM